MQLWNDLLLQYYYSVMPMHKQVKKKKDYAILHSTRSLKCYLLSSSQAYQVIDMSKSSTQSLTLTEHNVNDRPHGPRDSGMKCLRQIGTRHFQFPKFAKDTADLLIVLTV
jgi:hypothetical protein